MNSYPSFLRASPQLKSTRFPAKAAVPLLTTLLIFSLCLFPNLATAQSPHIYVVPHVGPPGSQAQVAGTGFDPNATIDIYFDSTDVGVVVSDSHGAFGMAATPKPTIRDSGFLIHVPKDAVQGTHWITAVERITQLQAQVPFTVRFDWPQFHFDAQHTGFNPYENVLNPDTVVNLTSLWKYTMGSRSYSSPAVANGVAYIGSEEDNNVYALDANTGVPLWKHLVGSGVPSSPAVANGMVYVATDYDASLYALNASTGSLRWKYRTGTVIWDAPTVAGSVVYIGSFDGNLYALNAETGALLWKYAAGALINSSPAVANGVLYFGCYDGNVYALNADTGALLWMYTLTHGYVQSSPAVANGVVYVGSVVRDYSLYALDAETGALLWKYTTGDYIFSSPAVANGAVYVGSDDGNIYALNATTGELLWKYTAGGSVGSSPAVANGVVYVGSGYPDNSLYALNASYRSGPLEVHNGLFGQLQPGSGQRYTIHR